MPDKVLNGLIQQKRDMPIVNRKKGEKHATKACKNLDLILNSGKPATDFHRLTRIYFLKIIRVDARESAALLHSFDDHRDALSTTDARRRKAVASAPPVQFVKDSQNEACTGRAERMSERNRTAIDVCTRAIQSEFFFHSQVLRCESFVHFH